MANFKIMEKEKTKEKEEKKPTIQDLNNHLEYWKKRLFEYLQDQNKLEERVDARKNIEYLEKEISELKSEKRKNGLDKEKLQVLYDNQSIISTSLSLKKSQEDLKKQSELIKLNKKEY